MSNPTHIGDVIRQNITPIIEGLATPCTTERAEAPNWEHRMAARLGLGEQGTGMTPDELREELNLDCYTAEQADQSQLYFEELVRECTEYAPTKEEEASVKRAIR